MDAQVGSAIKRIRTGQDLTLQALASKTSLSVSYLSLLERGLTSPTINNLQKICQALNITMSGLLSYSEQESLLVKESDRRLIYKDDNVVYESTTEVDKHLTGICMTIMDENIHVSDMHIADELGTVISGSMIVTLNNDTQYEVTEGDTLYIPAFTRHSFKKTSHKQCISLWVYDNSSKNIGRNYPFDQPTASDETEGN